MNYLDLFSGIGGFALGAYRAGWRFDRQYFSEIDPWCCRLYQQRFPDAIALGDIKGIDGRRLVSDAGCEHWSIQSRRQYGEDGASAHEPERRRQEWILSGGFPCQDISIAGKGAGLIGARSGLWFEYARLIGEIRPRYAVMENVGALTRRGLDRVLGSLAEIGFDAEWSDIRASDVGAPHRRERIWIVAYPGREHLDVQQPLQRVFESTRGRENVPNADSTRREEQRRTVSIREEHPTPQRSDWWATEPDVGRVAHGVPARVDRLKGLGNAIVPQIAELIFRNLKRKE